MKHKLIYPPRYPRGDPRNRDRMSAGAALGQKLQGQDWPIRKLRKIEGSYRITIPKWLVHEVGFKAGDGILFVKTEIPGALLIFATKLPEAPAGMPAAGKCVPF